MLRKLVIFEEPICQDCDNALSTDVDHIVAIEAGGNPWARANLQALCHPCHSTKTNQEMRAR
jgi:5-methylcytosine-specific restriction enzyme A